MLLASMPAADRTCKLFMYGSRYETFAESLCDYNHFTSALSCDLYIPHYFGTGHSVSTWQIIQLSVPNFRLPQN